MRLCQPICSCQQSPRYFAHLIAGILHIILKVIAFSQFKIFFLIQATQLLSEAFAAGCIPVFVGPPWHSMPFADIVDYKSSAIFLNISDYTGWMDQVHSALGHITVLQLCALMPPPSIST